jgi:hypothetical protein
MCCKQLVIFESSMSLSKHVQQRHATKLVSIICSVDVDIAEDIIHSYNICMSTVLCRCRE